MLLIMMIILSSCLRRMVSKQVVQFDLGQVNTSHVIDYSQFVGGISIACIECFLSGVIAIKVLPDSFEKFQ